MIRAEQLIHKAVVQHLRLRAKPGVLWWHTPSGAYYGQRGKRTRGGIAKGLGVRAGVSDLLFLHRGYFFALELKAPGGKVSAAQQAFLDDVTAQGGLAYSPYGLDDALATLEKWRLIKGTTR